MLSTSYEFRTKIAQNSKTLFKATLTLANGTVVNLTGDDVMMGTASFSEAVSSSGSFDIGAAIINQFKIDLNNNDRRFDTFDFTGATIVPYIGVELDGGRIEWLKRGRFGVEQPESYAGTIGLTCLDNMRLLDVPYSQVTTRYPATLGTIVRDLCRTCGVTLLSSAFENNNYVVSERPTDEALTCRDVISYAAQASGNYARCDAEGRVYVGWYDTGAIESEDWLDGMDFEGDGTPYPHGANANGGNFTNYGSGDNVDGGTFSARSMAYVYAYTDATIITDDVVITGIRVTAQDEVDEDGSKGREGETRLFGHEGYVLSVEGNPLILYGQANAVANLIGPRVVGMRFRPFDISAVGDPAYEAGDPIIITDRLQNQYLSYITSLTYKVGSYETLSCGAETPGRNKAAGYSALTKAIVEARNAVRQEKNARELAQEELARQLAESGGLYMTTERQSDGSNIYYMHDKPELRQSRIIWKLTANAFGVSTDGGTTWPYGFDVNGDAILNRIYAIGINADHIKTGRLLVGDASNPRFLADFNTNQVVVNAADVTLGSERISDVINGVRAVYGDCYTAAGTATKVVSIPGFVLRKGAVVNVRFSSKNTASNPTLNVNGTGAKTIRLNGLALSSSYYWNAYDVVSFVYDGNYWNIADSGTLSKIKTTADSISLSVSNGILGSEASIKLTVGDTTYNKTIDMRNVREKFANDTSAITISAGTITFNSNTFVVDSNYFKVTRYGVITATSGTIGGFTISAASIYNSKITLDATGMTLKNAGLVIGDIGTNEYSGDSGKKGLVFDLSHNGAYMSWASKTSPSASTYTWRLLYANKYITSGMNADTLHSWCDWYFHNYKAHDFWIDPNSGGANGGKTGTMNFVKVNTMSSDGTVANWTNGCQMVFKNGLLVGWTY